MTLHNPTADIFIPDGLAGDPAIARTTHLGIGAHQDDLEFMAFHGIAACYDSDTEWFGGVTCTNGAGSARPSVACASRERLNRAARARVQPRLRASRCVFLPLSSSPIGSEKEKR